MIKSKVASKTQPTESMVLESAVDLEQSALNFSLRLSEEEEESNEIADR